MSLSTNQNHNRPRVLEMFRRFITTCIALLPLVTGCGDPDLPLDPAPARGGDGVLTASVRVGNGTSSMFIADEVVASLSPSLRGRDLVIYARSYDLDETLAFVVDLNTVSLPGFVDLSTHGVLYLEPGAGTGGSDLLFDGVPQGTLEVEGNLTPGAGISGRFVVNVPGYDAGRPGDEFIASIEGSFVLPLLTPEP